MRKSVCVHLWTLKLYQVEGTVLVSVRIFFNKMNTYRLKRWNIWTICKAVTCFSNIARVKYSIEASHLHLHLLLLSYITPTNSRAKWEYYVKAWNYIKNVSDQETGNCAIIVQIIVKDDRGKAIAWRSISCKITCHHVSDEKKSINSQSSFFT